jgi:hypothetical protein
MQINGANLQAEEFISLLHRTLWMSGFILFHVLDIAKRFLLFSLSIASKMLQRIISLRIRKTQHEEILRPYDKCLEGVGISMYLMST